ncbi:uncharacterized protein JN550_008882 [Neoarthrinium moseri]|uniref:uncharacterized protein n=1 Tax=Neoarthrinium moseri TaxID=1658444 RepID=UPI001FDCA940|nr:uncharacterized protein JN550_008882 [Neoarthrinium moseri]KAI1864595.1 hypothetical protein JN550_008882 [Neoarthrinium moseri]
MGRPTILIIPGASATPELYESFVSAVVQRGYDIEALPIPSVGNANGSNGAPPTMYDDVTFIQSRIAALSDAGKDVIIVTHSYGGVPGTQCVQGFSKKERQSNGLEGGIIGLAYITSLIPELGQPAVSVQASIPEERKVPTAIDADGWVYYPDYTRLAEVSFTDMPGAEGLHWAQKLGKHSAAAFGSPLTYQGFKDVPVSYLLCKNDLVIPPEYQQAGIDMIEKTTGKKVDVTAIDSDHVAPLSHQQEVVDWIVGVADRLGKA